MKYDNEFTKYIGEFKNDKFDGHGKLYLECNWYYEGNFSNNNFSGKGIIYYPNQKIYYEGQFENNLINGEGIKYYTNGKIKTKVSFSNDKCVQGIYNNPDGIKIYEGEFQNGNPKESKNIIIYDNDGDKIYEGEIHNGLYEGEGIEYCPILKDRINYRGKFKNNLYELPDLDLVENKDKTIINSSRIVLFSHGDIPGKTCVIARLLGLDFFEGTLTTIGIDKRDIY